MNENRFVGGGNPYLLDNFSPVFDEIEIDNLTVIGKLPMGLNGTYLRNGPNPRYAPSGAYHWFDGDGMIHGVSIEDGQASYCNRFIATEGFLHEGSQGRSLWSGLTGYPNIRQILFPPKGLRTKNVANTALVWHSGRLLALWEVGEPHEIQFPGLKTIGTFDSGLPIKAFTAHPKIDPISGEMLFFGMQLGPRPRLHYGVADRQGKLTHAAQITLTDNVFMHDFAITENYTIFMDLPYVFSLKSMVTKGRPFSFNAARPSRFGIMPRYGDSNQITWFEDAPCYIYHTMNAFELCNNVGTTDEIVLIASRMERGTIAMPSDGTNKSPGSFNGQPLVQIDDENLPRLYEWRFNLHTGKVRSSQLDDRPNDFPRLNDNLMGLKNRYGYTANLYSDQRKGTPHFTGVVKYDFNSGLSVSHDYGPKHYCGEAVFVANSSSSIAGRNAGTSSETEDDGWLLNYVFDSETGTSELVVVDAKTMDAEPVARVLLPQRVPYGFHGTWIPLAE